MKKVYLRQLKPGFCIPGTKAFFLRHGLDFKDFKQNGIDPQKLIDTQDELAKRLATRAVDEKHRNLTWEKVQAVKSQDTNTLQNS